MSVQKQKEDYIKNVKDSMKIMTLDELKLIDAYYKNVIDIRNKKIKE